MGRLKRALNAYIDAHDDVLDFDDLDIAEVVRAYEERSEQ